MTDLVARYIKQLKDKGISKTEGAKQLNAICHTKLRVQEINSMESGKRHVTLCHHYIMLNYTLTNTLAEFGFKRDKYMTGEEWISFIDSIMPPKRL